MRDFLRRHEEAVKTAANAALKEVQRLNLPASLDYMQPFDQLGQATLKVVGNTAETLLKRHGSELSYVIAAAHRLSWFANWNGAYYMMFAGLGTLNTGPRAWTADLYGTLEGWANTLYEELSNTRRSPERDTLLSDIPLSAPLSLSSAMLAMATGWFNSAASELAAGRIQSALDWQAEAFVALKLERGDEMWTAGVTQASKDVGAEAIASAKSALARRAASARHAENRALKAVVFAWCDDNLSAFRSMDSAAGHVAGVVVPVAWRTVRDWMTEWKKLRSAGTP
ncbi:hypothetical protein [Variovorax paradoxus]|uniref:hypothetical protein n=1 Tax=Variovorax paradoxus TaxID=34073 RepID=UPI001ABCDEE9